MAVLSIPDLKVQIDALINTNGNRSVTGLIMNQNLQDIIDSLEAISGGGGGAVTSIFGRTGAVAAVLNDYQASLVDNDSAVVGVTVKNALETLKSLIDNLDSDDVVNASGVTGVSVSDALDELDSKIINHETLIISLTAPTGPISVDTDIEHIYMPYGMDVSEVRATSDIAPTGSNIIIDINESGISILSTKINIDAGTQKSTDSGTLPVINDSLLADGARVSFDADQVGSTLAGAGVKIYIKGIRL
jgi:hypothetical protein